MLVEIALFLAALAVLFIIWKFVKNAFLLAVNSVIGLFALHGFNILFGANIAKNFWSVIITAIGGIFGFIFVLIAHYLGWAF